MSSRISLMNFPNSRACRRRSSLRMISTRSSMKLCFCSRKDTTRSSSSSAAGTLPPLDLDREQIKRVLINLLDNAVAAVDDAGRNQAVDEL